jgi:hypothetical protein
METGLQSAEPCTWDPCDQTEEGVRAEATCLEVHHTKPGVYRLRQPGTWPKSTARSLEREDARG